MDSTCSVDGCERPAQVLGWCRGHHQRVRRNGEPGSPTFRKHGGYKRDPDAAPDEPSCAVDGCPGPQRVRGWCRPHYLRWWRLGDPGPAILHRNGMFEVCSAEGCERPHRTKGFCDMHYRRWKRGVPTDSLKFKTPPVVAKKATYGAIHMQLRAVRGRAAEHECVACGSSASVWAYQHNDPDALTDERGYHYSPKLMECYEPMCHSCHGRLDRDHDELAARRAEFPGRSECRPSTSTPRVSMTLLATMAAFLEPHPPA